MQPKATTHLVSSTLRLDLFLTNELGISRSQVQKLIAEELVVVNGKLPKKSGDTVKAGDTVEVKEEKGESPAEIAEHKKKAKNNKKVAAATMDALAKQVKIIHEDADFLVVEKPSGLLTHATMAHEPITLASVLLAKYPELKKVGDDEVRPGIVHRLDKEASGLLVVARTPEMFMHLKHQFQERTIQKEYLVLVHEAVARDEDEIIFPLARSGRSERMAAIPLTRNGVTHDDGKQAHTEFLVERRFVDFTLLRVTIHTGRMHQIRAHMLAYNHPVVGDPLYFQKKMKRHWDTKCGRLFLHSTRLGFTDLAGEKREFISPLPTELADFLELLS